VHQLSVDCEEAGCAWLEPGCDALEEFQPSCQPVIGCDEGSYECAEDFECRTVVYNPCLGDEGCDACAAERMACLPLLMCSGFEAPDCGAAGCRFLEVGCDEPAIPNGCYALRDCTEDSDCRDSTTCQEVFYDPCVDEPCDACSAPVKVCLP
jgi:hypothetical protein